MIKNRILLASVLKPINDTRMYGKLGVSLAKLSRTHIHIAGYHGPIPPAPANMFFHPIFRFKRLSWQRFLAPLIFFKHLWKLSPHVIILGTHELLLISVIYKIFRRCRLIYDVRENYYLNLTSQKVYAPLTSRLLAFAIRITEKLTAPFVSHFFLAEKSYANELPFVQSKYLTLQNKFQPPYPQVPLPPVTKEIILPTHKIQLVYSGTISELYGVFRAVTLCKALNQVAPIYFLTIVGYCTQPAVLHRLKAEIAGNQRITLIGGDILVPHHKILQAIAQSHVGLLPYFPHPSLVGCVPTKLYEYIGQALPVIAQQNPLWQEQVNHYQAGITIDYEDYQALEVHEKLSQGKFFPQQDLTGAYWLSEEKKLLAWAETTI